VEVNIATTAVVGGKVKDDADTFDGPLDNVLTSKIGVDEPDSPGIDQLRDVLDPTTAQIIDNSHARAASYQLFDKVRAYERGATRDEYVAAHPVQVSLRCQIPSLHLSIAVRTLGTKARESALRPRLLRRRTTTDVPRIRPWCIT
jgi:hypothetical protein